MHIFYFSAKENCGHTMWITIADREKNVEIRVPLKMAGYK